MNFLPLEPYETSLPVDFVLVSPEAYVDHPSFGHAIISRVVEAEGFSVAILAQPQHDADFLKFGRPRKAFLVSGGVVDSMVNNYTSAKKRRSNDVYSEGGKAGRRPDRAVTVYCRALKRLFPDVAVIIGGMEASLRRMAHYDYWSDSVMPSILVDSKADLLIYGMGERPLWDLLDMAKKGASLDKVKDIRGTGYLSTFDGLSKSMKEKCQSGGAEFCPTFEETISDKKKFLKAYKQQAYCAADMKARPLVQKHGRDYVVINPPAIPLTQEEMDRVYALPFTGEVHPSYKDGVPAIQEVKFSITSHRGCFGGCSFCALSFHQGRMISKRSKESIIFEAVELTQKPDFKGYIHDIGGPTANFRNPPCKKRKDGVCPGKRCIGAKVCENLEVDHSEYLDILREARALPNVKKVFVRSGIRFDYLMYDKNKEFFRELVAHHISGQLKVAPEHSEDSVLRLMNKPPFAVYKAFTQQFKEENHRQGKEQYLVPYLISSHPGCTVGDAMKLTEYLKSTGYMPEQVQDFYPTPSTRSTCMYYTGIDPETDEEIYVASSVEEKRTQRALLQYRKKENLPIIQKAYAEQQKKPPSNTRKR
ncbi:MAG: YgiQ family radical SAM protein [Clostridia bacterium]|nr:YgiQ family radical SAM protein [Clostridia bacterium]